MNCWIVIEAPGRTTVLVYRPGDVRMKRWLHAGWQVVRICRGTLDEALNLTAGG